MNCRWSLGFSSVVKKSSSFFEASNCLPKTYGISETTDKVSTYSWQKYRRSRWAQKELQRKRPAFCQYLGLRVRGRGIISPTPNSIRNILNEWKSFFLHLWCIKSYYYVVHVKAIWIFVLICYWKWIDIWLISRIASMKKLEMEKH